MSNTVDAWLCREVLDAALATNAQPEIFNTDQGSQFTSQLFLAPLKERNIRISMDGRGRALDNAFIERLWRTVKYEYIYLHEHTSLAELRDGLRRFFYEYNFLRPHQALQIPHARRSVLWNSEQKRKMIFFTWGSAPNPGICRFWPEYSLADGGGRCRLRAFRLLSRRSGRFPALPYPPPRCS